MKRKLIRDLKRLSSTLGVSGSIMGIAAATGARANGHISLKFFFICIIILVAVALISVSYINLNTRGGEWIDY